MNGKYHVPKMKRNVLNRAQPKLSINPFQTRLNQSIGSKSHGSIL